MIKEIPIENIVKGKNIRTEYDYDSITDLAKSILSVGLINPITVKKEKDKYKIIAGYRRFMACQFAKMKTIQCNVIDKINIVQLQLIENIQRNDISDIDLEKAIKRLIDSGITQEAVGDMINKTQSWVSRVLNVNNIRRRIDEDTSNISTNVLAELTTIPEKKQQKAIKELKNKKPTVKNAREINKKYSTSNTSKKNKISKNQHKFQDDPFYKERLKLWEKVSKEIYALPTWFDLKEGKLNSKDKENYFKQHQITMIHDRLYKCFHQES